MGFRRDFERNAEVSLRGKINPSHRASVAPRLSMQRHVTTLFSTLFWLVSPCFDSFPKLWWKKSTCAKCSSVCLRTSGRHGWRINNHSGQPTLVSLDIWTNIWIGRRPWIFHKLIHTTDRIINIVLVSVYSHLHQPDCVVSMATSVADWHSWFSGNKNNVLLFHENIDNLKSVCGW